MAALQQQIENNLDDRTMYNILGIIIDLCQIVGGKLIIVKDSDR